MATLVRDDGQDLVVSDFSREAGDCAGRRAVQESAGFTLLQLVVVIAVVGVLVSLAFPITVGALRDYRLSAAVNQAISGILVARYKAIMHAYPYNITFNAANATYQIASEPPPATTFSNVGSAVPLSGNGLVTINQTTTLQFNANGTVTATAGSLIFTISDPITTHQHTITVTGVGDVSSK